MIPKNILIVDDIENERFLLVSSLAQQGYKILEAKSGKDALDIFESQRPDLIISDHVMPGMNGIELLKKIRKKADTPFILVTGHACLDNAVSALKIGADDYITKPFITEDLLFRTARALKYRELLLENEEVKQHNAKTYGFQSIIGQSPNIVEIKEKARKILDNPEIPVLILGQSGTGKELLARAIHNSAKCRPDRFAGVNCAGIPETLLETELFGHVRGAFTGADNDRMGKLDFAQKGTLLLDEIGDMPFKLQAKLLRVIQERTYERLGSTTPVPLNARIIAATHRDIPEMVKQGKFREDLFFRINAYPLILPPLKERKQDILLLADHFMNQFRNEFGRPIPGISKAAIKAMTEYNWPGNVRELKNCIERAILLSNNELIRPDHLFFEQKNQKPGDNFEEDNKIRISLTFDMDKFSLDAATDGILQIVLDKCRGNKKQAAELLGRERKIFYRRKKTE